jgi:hypothetical protein
MVPEPSAEKVDELLRAFEEQHDQRQDEEHVERRQQPTAAE